MRHRAAVAVTQAVALITCASVWLAPTGDGCCGGRSLDAYSGRCTGDVACRACKDCSKCKHCNRGGKCGVCAKVRSGQRIERYSRNGTPIGPNVAYLEGSEDDPDRPEPVPSSSPVTCRGDRTCNACRGGCARCPWCLDPSRSCGRCPPAKLRAWMSFVGPPRPFR